MKVLRRHYNLWDMEVMRFTTTVGIFTVVRGCSTIQDLIAFFTSRGIYEHAADDGKRLRRRSDILVQHILEAMDTTPQQDFVFGISVQGHGDYPEEAGCWKNR